MAISPFNITDFGTNRKLVVDLLKVTIERFSLSLTAKALYQRIRRNRPLVEGVGHFKDKN